MREASRFDKDVVAFLVRGYRPADAGPLARFYRDFEPKRTAQGLPPADPARIDRWLAGVLDVGIHLVVVREDELIGHAFIAPTDRPGIGEYAVFLHHDHRGRGIGSEVNRVAVDAAREAGLNGLWLTVEPMNRAAIQSYRNAGFDFVFGTAYSTEPEMQLIW